MDIADNFFVVKTSTERGGILRKGRLLLKGRGSQGFHNMIW